MLQINKDTKIYGSFSQNPGNKGCEFFNKKFEDNGINAFYKSFSSNNIFESLNSAKVLNFSGCAIAMPFKTEAFNIVDNKDNSAILSNSVNTIIFENNLLYGYNTDYYAAIDVIDKYKINGYENVYVFGIGGLGKAVCAALKTSNLIFNEMNRYNINELKNVENSFIFNCTPIDIITPTSNFLFDCRVTTDTGEYFRVVQAEKQFELYMGIGSKSVL